MTHRESSSLSHLTDWATGLLKKKGKQKGSLAAPSTLMPQKLSCDMPTTGAKIEAAGIKPNINTIPYDLRGYGSTRLKQFEDKGLKSMCTERGLSVGSTASLDDIVQMLLEWKINYKAVESNAYRKHIFMSFSWSDNAKVQLLSDRLRMNNYAVWPDEGESSSTCVRGSVSGFVQDRVEEAMDVSPCIIVCVSKSYKNSERCHTEVSYAHENKLKLIFVMMEENYTTSSTPDCVDGTAFPSYV